MNSFVLQLIRFLDTGNETLGYLKDGNNLFFTLEPAWRKNAFNISCIPAGVYQFQLNQNGIFQAVNTAPRTGIQIHTGNTRKDTQGCQLIGLACGNIDGVPAVLQSRKAFDIFMKERNATFLLEIVNRTGIKY